MELMNKIENHLDFILLEIQKEKMGIGGSYEVIEHNIRKAEELIHRYLNNKE